MPDRSLGSLLTVFQTRAIETQLAILQDDSSDVLPPLMNPALLEASDDLTNLSHLNEPAGMLLDPGGEGQTCSTSCSAAFFFYC